MFYTLKLKELVLSVNLGCGDIERSQKQEVRTSVELRFKKKPTSMKSDHLEDTICYGKISNAIRHHCDSREFKLIERMGFEIYEVVSEILSELSLNQGPIELAVTVHKVHPPVDGLLGGSYFSCGDFQT
jgi:dihydroneopterin aldolase